MDLDQELHIGTRPIHIHFTSNLPDGSSDTILTRDLFYDQHSTVNKEQPSKEKENTAKYPFFSDIVEYSLESFKQYSRAQIVDIFFNKEQFKMTMKIGSDKIIPSYEKRQRNSKNNVMVMLQLLFPTSFPVKGNIHDTFVENIEKQVTNVPVEMSILPSFVKKLIGAEEKNSFSHIQRSSGIFTVMEVFWMNDIINHPDYSRLFRELYNQSHFIAQQNKRNEDRMKEIEKKMEKLYENFYKDFIVDPKNASLKNEIETYSTNAAKRSTKRVSPERVNDILRKLPKPNEPFANIISVWFELYKLKLDAAKYNSDPNIIPPLLLRSFKETSQLLELASEYEYLVTSDKYRTNFTKYEAFMKKKTTNLEPWDLEVREKMSASSQKTNVIQILKQFTPLKRSCSNKKLQEQLNSFLKNGIQNEASSEFIQYIMDLMRNGKSKLGGGTDYLEIGVVSNSDAIVSKSDDKKTNVPEDVFAETKNEFYEIYLRLNFIEGILDMKNLPLIKCSYENSNLVRMREQLIHKVLKQNPMLLYSVFPLIKLDTLMPKQTKRLHRVKKTGGFRTKGTKRRRKSIRETISGGSKISACNRRTRNRRRK